MSMSLPASHVPHSSLTLPAERTLGPWNRALFLAIERMDLEAAQWALGKGAQINVHCPFDTTEGGQPGTAIIRGGFTPLHEACWANASTFTWSQVRSMVDLLLGAGADTDLPYAQLDPRLPAFTPLDLAVLNLASWGIDLCRHLCKHGAQPTALTVATAAIESEHYAPLLDLFFTDVSQERRAALLGAHPLAKLAEQPVLTEQHVDRMAELMRHGASLAERERGQRGTPLDMLRQHHPDRLSELLARTQKDRKVAKPRGKRLM